MLTDAFKPKKPVSSSFKPTMAMLMRKINFFSSAPFQVIMRSLESDFVKTKMRAYQLASDQRLSLRVVFDDISDLDAVCNAILGGYVVSKIHVHHDHFSKENQDGYRAHHFVFEMKGVPVELQLLTWRMHLLSSAAHRPYVDQALSLGSFFALANKVFRADKGGEATVDELLCKPDELKEALYGKKQHERTASKPGNLDSILWMPPAPAQRLSMPQDDVHPPVSMDDEPMNGLYGAYDNEPQDDDDDTSLFGGSSDVGADTHNLRAALGARPEYDTPHTPEQPERSIRERFTRTAADEKGAQQYQYPGELGKFLGRVTTTQQHWTLQGPAGAGKSYLQFQMLDLFMGYHEENAAILCWEWGPEQFPIYRDRAVSKINYKRLHPIYLDELPQTIETLEEVCKDFRIVGLDSWTIADLDSRRFKDVLLRHPDTIIVVIFQERDAGKVYGGQKPLYSASACIRVQHGPTDALNHGTFLDKNRFGPTSGILYSPYLRRMITEHELKSKKPKISRPYPLIWDQKKMK